MTDLKEFPITQKWPPQDASKIQLYSLPTPNGVKVSLMLEELVVPYEVHKIDIMSDVQFTEEYLSLSPNNKIPAIIDPDGPGGRPIGIFESGAILIYLAEKYSKFWPSDQRKRYECMQWVMWQMGGFGPMIGQFGHFFKFAADKVKDPYPKERYTNEAKRLLGVLDKRLEGQDWIMADGYTIADMMIAPWVYCIEEFYNGADAVALKGHKNAYRWYQKMIARPAFERAKNIPNR